MITAVQPSTTPVQTGGQSAAGPDQHIITAAKGGSITFAGKVIMYVLSFGFSVGVARFLGAEPYGLYKLAITIVTILAAVSFFGLDGGLVRFLPIARKEKNEARVWGLMQLGAGIPLLISLFLSALFLVFAEPIAADIIRKPELLPVLRVGVLAVPLAVLLNSLAAIAQGFKAVQYITYAQDIGFNVIKLLLSLGLLLLGFGVLELTVAYALSTAVAAFWMLYYVHRLFPLNRRNAAAQRNAREIFHFSIPLYLQRLLNRFGGDFEILFLGFFGVLADVGVYGAILPLSAIGNMALDSVRKISEPIISELHSQGDIGALKRFYQTTTKWALSFNLPIFLTILLFAEVLLGIFGREFTVGAAGLVILAAGVLFNVASGTCGTVINMTGHSRLGLLNSAVYLVTTIVLDFLLIPQWHLLGAALAASLTILINNLLRLGEVYLLFNRLVPFNKSFAKPLVATLLAGGLTHGLIQLVWVGQPLRQFMVFVPLMWLVYGLSIFALGLSEDDRQILDKLRNRAPSRRK